MRQLLALQIPAKQPALCRQQIGEVVNVKAVALVRHGGVSSIFGRRAQTACAQNAS
jgi:hypothetical protein